METSDRTLYLYAFDDFAFGSIRDWDSPLLLIGEVRLAVTAVVVEGLKPASQAGVVLEAAVRRPASGERFAR